MTGTAMSRAECLRTLGVAPDASWEDIRQAYLDLVRVWHPDRFQSDANLRSRAEQQLQKVNEAYLSLKKSREYYETAEANPKMQAPPGPEHEPPRATSVPRARRRWAFRPWRTSGRRQPFGFVWLATVCLSPFLFASVLVNFLRVTYPDLSVIEGGPRPAILTPSRILNPLAGVSAATETLSSWARGEGIDLWKATPRAGGNGAVQPVETAVSGGLQEGTAAASESRRRTAPPVVVPAPENGTEMRWTQRSGAGELWIANQADRDAIATLTDSKTGEPVRAIYIQAGNKVCLRGVAIGLYDLAAEIGRDWDGKALRFRSERLSLGKSGPFQFFDISSGEGRTGQRYEIALRSR